MRGRRTLLGKRERKSGEADRVSATSRAGGREARGQGGAPKRHELGSFRQLLLMVTRRVRRRGKFCRGWK